MCVLCTALCVLGAEFIQMLGKNTINYPFKSIWAVTVENIKLVYCLFADNTTK